MTDNTMSRLEGDPDIWMAKAWVRVPSLEKTIHTWGSSTQSIEEAKTRAYEILNSIHSVPTKTTVGISTVLYLKDGDWVECEDEGEYTIVR